MKKRKNRLITFIIINADTNGNVVNCRTSKGSRDDR
jgi:hypothetical protein